ncbi:HDIG domain-containing protein [Parabacteroides sp. 52]|uniref:HDIG domain-containing metalloprotein n=1 Tax=unclassified Parabacteroides TaxID=2649774 RepID=UPI0013D0899B|nr:MULTISPECIES: HDIG domain-containing metalloprotein [unclassified Parabacteroides]NDV54855.1 HDIG domain-containing protein [Parabacteroides sp. 52]
MDPYQLIEKYYPVGSESYKILVAHSRSVADKALSIARLHPEMALDKTFIEEAALLHDIGVFLCHAPSIGCRGEAEYICHGYLGADLMRKEGFPRHALVCERHTGTGISLQMIREQKLPLPLRNFLPETLEEQLICFADKFFSKTKLEKEKSVDKIKQGLSRYGKETTERFDDWCKLFLG